MAPTMVATSTAEPAPSHISWRRRYGSTTPGQLRLESLAVVALAIIAALVLSFFLADSASGARRIADEAEPVIVSARKVQTNLADANAAAATAFLAGGEEDVAQRQHYEAAMTAAATELERATRLTGDDEDSHERLVAMTGAMPRYAGLIETARTNNRQGYPVGAAYLDEASSLLVEEIYPGTDLVANRAAGKYLDSYNRLRGATVVLGLITIVILAGIALILVGLQFQLRRRFRRTLNPPMMAATVIAALLTIWVIGVLSTQVSGVTEARTDGYQGVRLYLDMRGVGFGAKADEARFLIARGAGDRFEADFDQRSKFVDGMRSDLDNHASDSADTASALGRVDQSFQAWSSYAEAHRSVIEADRSGRRLDAVDQLFEASDRFTEFDAVTDEALAENEAFFESEMDDARRASRGLRVGGMLALGAIAGLTLFGLQLRVNEYR